MNEVNPLTGLAINAAARRAIQREIGAEIGDLFRDAADPEFLRRPAELAAEKAAHRLIADLGHTPETFAQLCQNAALVASCSSLGPVPQIMSDEEARLLAPYREEDQLLIFRLRDHVMVQPDVDLPHHEASAIAIRELKQRGKLR